MTTLLRLIRTANRIRETVLTEPTSEQIASTFQPFACSVSPLPKELRGNRRKSWLAHRQLMEAQGLRMTAMIARFVVKRFLELEILSDEKRLAGIST